MTDKTPSSVMLAFMEHNSKTPIVSASCEPAWGPPDKITHTNYRFDDGSRRRLSVANARTAPEGWRPKWKGI